MTHPKPPGGPTLLQSTYDRSATAVGVVHLGVGAFHRAHQATYFDAFMDRSGDLGWAIAGVNLRSDQSANARRLSRRNGEYVLKTMPPEGPPEFRLVRSITRILDWAEDASAAEGILAEESVRAATVTVTESGYCLDKDAGLDLSNAEIQSELNGTGTSTVYAYLRNALNRRRAVNAGPLTILCCDNIRDNGTMLERNLQSYLRELGDEGLSDWIESNVSFPCSMVDRITPRPNQSVSDEVFRLFDIGNDFSVHAEDYIQWVVEDNFRGARPDLSAVGVEMVKDVHPHETAKIRILNGGHTSLAYFGALLGHETFDAAIRTPRLTRAFDEFAFNEVIPTLDKDTPVDLPNYAKLIRRRFLNRNIADSISRIAMDGVSKFPIFVVPTVRECLRKGIEPARCIQAIASWYVFMRHARSGLIRFEYVDPLLDLVSEHLAEGRETSFAGLPELWGDIPAQHPKFVDAVCAEIGRISAEFSTPSR